ncbi:hypothetical protein KIM372_15260 [Bombiscardovia nodaiensis]|uniref:Transposase n=1 Tax=Bombiscardovia nodaiensis TaxID=2932181 RepID=A0ABN6SDA5_9BIFI|nr:hypothetical protein KIM372_15260 [Bombiscardovia nodaiensis]
MQTTRLSPQVCSGFKAQVTDWFRALQVSPGSAGVNYFRRVVSLSHQPWAKCGLRLQGMSVQALPKGKVEDENFKEREDSHNEDRD